MRRLPLVLTLLLFVALPLLSRAEEEATETVRITARYHEADVRQVVADIARQAEANIILGEKIQGTITVTLQDVPWRQALEQVVRTAGFALVEEDHGILRVTAQGAELGTGYHRFRHRLPRSPAQLGQDPSTPPVHPPIVAALQRIVELEHGAARYIPAQKTVVYTGTLRTLETVKAILDAFDQPPAVDRATETRRHYERLLADARTETAAAYFKYMIEATRKP